MEISPERQESIETSLSLFMSEEEAEQFLVLSYALNSLKKGPPSWQALVSIGVHVAELYLLGETEAEKAILKDVTDYSLEPLEALLESLTPESGKDAATKEERDRLLFHTRFAFGFLMLAKGEKERARKTLHEMAATKLSMRGNEFRSGPGIVNWTSDIAQGKWFTALHLLAEYRQQEDYEEILYLMTEAAACNTSDSIIGGIAPVFLDLWAAQCEKEDDSCVDDFPTLCWLDLFAASVDMLSLCQEVDASDALPSECKKWSPQFLAWEFGQLVGRLCVHHRWCGEPFGAIIGFFLDIGLFEDDLYSHDRGKAVRDSLASALAVVSAYDQKRNWEEVRHKYISMWRGCSYASRGTNIAEIGSSSDLYWSIRIGFADKILEHTRQIVIPVQTLVESPEARRDSESTININEVMALRLMKLERGQERILKRLSPDRKEIEHELEGKLGSVWRELPRIVVNRLVKAEKYYKTEVDDEDAKVWFNKSVEASLDFCIVRPLLTFLQKQERDEINIWLPPPQKSKESRPYQKKIGKLALWEWGAVLETLNNARGKVLSDLGNCEFIKFMEMHLGGPHFPDFRSLSESLRSISNLKGGSSHYKDAEVRSDTERDELIQMHNLVPSVIVQIFQLLSAKSSS